MDFHSKPQSPQEMLKMIARVPYGRQVLEKFMPIFTVGKVKIEPYPLEIVEKLRMAIGEDQPIGACFTNDGKTGSIYMDFSSPIGVLAAFLVHEMIHSLDPDTWKVSAAITHEQKDDIFLHAEIKAFEGQNTFMQEMKERFPEYKDFLSEKYPRAKILHEKLTAPDIAELYGFKAS